MCQLIFLRKKYNIPIIFSFWWCFYNNSNNKGMTLLEIVVVMTLLAGFLIVGVPLVKKRENAVKQMLRHITAINRQLDSQARLKGVTYRLVFSIDPKDSSWWVEKKQDLVKKQISLDTLSDKSDDTLSDTLSDKLDNKLDDTLDDTQESKEDTQQSEALMDQVWKELLNNNYATGEFKKDTSVLKNKQTLPSGLVFDSLSFDTGKKLVSQGLAYIYYTPGGQFNKVLLKIKGRSRYWSLLFNRLNGELDVF